MLSSRRLYLVDEVQQNKKYYLYRQKPVTRTRRSTKHVVEKIDTELKVMNPASWGAVQQIEVGLVVSYGRFTFGVG